jgi:hypothetical protein
MPIQRVSVEGEAGEPTWTEPDKDGKYVYWEDVKDLQSRYEKAMRYSIDLQRAIEYHCRGEKVPDRVAEGCPFHANALNARLQAVTSEA